MPTQRAQDTSSPINAPDYDLFDLIAVATASGTPPVPYTPNPTTTNIAPFFWESLGSAAFPPYGAIVVCTDNYVISLENLNLANNTAEPAVFSLQQFVYGITGTNPPYLTAGPVILVEDVAAATSKDLDNTKTRIVCPPGSFLALFVTGVFSSNTATVTARARHTQG